MRNKKFYLALKPKENTPPSEIGNYILEMNMEAFACLIKGGFDMTQVLTIAEYYWTAEEFIKQFIKPVEPIALAEVAP